MLARPIQLILRINVFEIADNALITSWKPLLFERIAKFTLDCVLLTAKKCQECPNVIARDVKLGADLFFGSGHHGV
jgi:hypothetical protein